MIINDDRPQAKDAAGEAFTIADRINDACSTQMADAQVQSFCRKEHGQPHEVGPGFFEALTLARGLAERTDGHFDPATGLGLTRFISATVIADTATAAAALATAACIAGPEVTKASLAGWGGTAARITCDQDGKRQLLVTDGFPAATHS